MAKEKTTGTKPGKETKTRNPGKTTQGETGRTGQARQGQAGRTGQATQGRSGQSGQTGRGKSPEPQEIESYLEGCEFPCGRQEIVDHLKEQGAPDNMVRRFRELPDGEYQDSDEVVEAFTGQTTTAPSGGGRR